MKELLIIGLVCVTGAGTILWFIWDCAQAGREIDEERGTSLASEGVAEEDRPPFA